MLLSRQAVQGFNRFNGVLKSSFQKALTDYPEYEAEYPSLEILAFERDADVKVGCAAI